MLGLGVGQVSMGGGVAPVNNDWNFTIDTELYPSFPNLEFKFRAHNESAFTVDWGDGNTESLNYATTTLVAHTYASHGVYDVVVSGYCELDFYNTGNSSEFRVLKVTNCSSNAYSLSTFRTCYRVIEIDFTNFKNSNNNLSWIFYGIGNISASLISNPEQLETGGVTSLSWTFAASKINSDLGVWDLRNITTMSNFANSVTTWSQANYSASLMGWLRWDSVTHAPAVGWVLPSTITFHGGSSTVAIGSEAALARTYLISTLGWTITDGGEI